VKAVTSSGTTVGRRPEMVLTWSVRMHYHRTVPAATIAHASSQDSKG
jgi:hypothetical protein